MNTDIAALAPDETKLEEQEDKALEIARAMVISDDQGIVMADQFCAAHRAITAQESSHLARVVEPRAIVVKKMRTFRDQQEAARQAEEKRLQAIENKRAEEAALQSAIEAEKSGYKEEAEAIMAAPVVAAPVIVERTAPKLQTRIADTWTFTAIPIDKMTNQQIVNARAYLTWDTLKLGQQARSTHETVKVDGVRFHIKTA